MLPVRRALLSVSDKAGLLELARRLTRLGIEILSTGGTARFLAEAGVPVVAVSQVTGFPEILDGRVKTLHPLIHGGILADRSRAAHLHELAEHGITPIDLVVVNLYPFAATVEAQVSYEETVEMIDVGGPTMVRAAAKNHQGMAVVVDPADYPGILAALESGGRVISLAERQRLAAKAFRHSRDYDAAIAAWFERQLPPAEPANEFASGPQGFPTELRLELVQVLAPRYGENPHQRAAVYAPRGGTGLLGGFEQIQGKELSWNNLLDADAARKLVAQWSEPAVAIVKHNNPCGVGVGRSLKTAYDRALASDPVSAFGSIVAVNRPLDAATAKAMDGLFIEVVVAPAYEPKALTLMTSKKSRRLLLCPLFELELPQADLRSIAGGFLVQDLDAPADDPGQWRAPTRKRPTTAEKAALELAWKACRYVKSNAIVIANRQQTVGIGAGQMSRVDACRLAIDKARLPVAGAVAASDAFFPFRDGLDLLADAGVTAVVHPGGSVRDDEVIAAADERGLCLITTGRRHFRH